MIACRPQRSPIFEFSWCKPGHMVTSLMLKIYVLKQGYVKIIKITLLLGVGASLRAIFFFCLFLNLSPALPCLILKMLSFHFLASCFAADCCSLCVADYSVWRRSGCNAWSQAVIPCTTLDFCPGCSAHGKVLEDSSLHLQVGTLNHLQDGAFKSSSH